MKPAATIRHILSTIRHIIKVCAPWLRHDRKLLYVTVALIILGGLVRVIDYGVSEWIIFAAFMLYSVLRGRYYYCRRRRPWLPVEKQRFIVLAILFSIVTVNIFLPLLGILTAYRSEFLPFILLVIEYLLLKTD